MMNINQCHRIFSAKYRILSLIQIRVFVVVVVETMIILNNIIYIKDEINIQIISLIYLYEIFKFVPFRK